jgi:hypothetical protein
MTRKHILAARYIRSTRLESFGIYCNVQMLAHAAPLLQTVGIIRIKVTVSQTIFV